MNKTKLIMACLCLGVVLLSEGCRNNKETLGVGVYPGDPEENFAPLLRPDNDNYRNIAKLRPAYHSSAYDYNLTAQLVTDGIIINETPVYFKLAFNGTDVPKNQREFLFDHVSGSTVSSNGNNLTIDYSRSGNGTVPAFNRIVVNGELIYDKKLPGNWEVKLSGSHNGEDWEVLKDFRGTGFPGTERPNPFESYMKNPPKDSTGKPIDPFEAFFGPKNPGEPKPSFQFNFGMPEPTRIINQEFIMEEPVSFPMYRIEFLTESGLTWQIGDLNFFNQESLFEMSPSNEFKSAWMSAGSEKEWIYVDLGSYSIFDRIKLHWINRPESGSIEISADARKWKEIKALPTSNQENDEILFDDQVRAQFVKIALNKSANGQPYILSEFEVFGKGGLVGFPHKPAKLSAGMLNLAGGNWKIQRASLVKGNGESISTNGFDETDWIIATVPGTVLVSYINAGALPDPNFGDNQTQISESFFNSNFWYRNEFEVPRKLKQEHIFLNFDGINWKADVFINGSKIGRINGAFTRAKFDVTDLLKTGTKNVLAVYIYKNDHPGNVTEQSITSADRNGGVLGADNPTYHASIGWDWIPTIRGRNIGIWNDVFLSSSGEVVLNDPFVYSDLNLPDTNQAEIHIAVSLQNLDGQPVSGVLSGTFGDIRFEEKVDLNANETKIVRLEPSTHPELNISNPKLWWPNGYGPQNLYDVSIEFKIKGNVSDRLKFQSGIREMSYTDENQILNLFINGRRFIARGGNWGFPESNLLYRAREYDIAVAYHADMNFTMIRNWVAQTADDEFFEACDKHGLLVWQDFCLANPADGPDPQNPEMFIQNADDVIRKIRNHPSIGIYVGRNEGNPPEVIDTALQNMVNELHPGILYIPNSAGGSVSGGGPYRALPVKDYYLLYGRNKLHSERGMPNMMNFESLYQMLPDSQWWPQNKLWGLHDFTLEGAQSCASFNELVEKGFGVPDDVYEFTKWAQWINYDGYRAMFEGRSQYRMGLLLWMSHSAWPSMVWQTYDYYFDPTAAYFACKKASEPIHIQWNRVYDDVEAVNLNAGDLQNLKATAQIFGMDGKIIWQKEAPLNINEDATVKIFKLEFAEDLPSVYFVRLQLWKDETLISDNFYWAGKEEDNFRALNDLESVTLKKSTRMKSSGNEKIITVTLENESETPALMIRLSVAAKDDNLRILPVFFSDNYFSLMPGEKKTITIKFKDEDTRQQKPVIKVFGFNIKDRKALL